MFNNSEINTVKDWLKPDANIIITAHKSADGDSVGSSLALYQFLKKQGKNVTICHPDGMPHFYEWLEDSDEIVTFDTKPEEVAKLLSKADLIFCLDYNHPSRLGDMEGSLRKATGKKIMIDHHQNPDIDSFDMIFSYPTISSTCELIYEFITALGFKDKIDELIGKPIYCGIMTDTGSFRFPSTSAQTHTIIAHLIELGIKNHTIHEQVFDNNTISRIKLNGYAMSEKLTVLENVPAAYIALSSEELKTYNATKGDTEGLVNKALSITGVKLAVFLKEDGGYIKMSFRSKGDTYVNQLANDHFEGGGHIYAAGGKFDGSLADAVEKLVTLLPDYVTN